MCIFTQPVVSVADTRIFARLTAPGRQLLVYEMAYAAADDLAMVLPLPVGSRDEDTAVRFIDLSSLPDFFDRLGRFIRLWPEDMGFEILGSMLVEDEVMVDRPPIEVHEVGAFDASFVPSLSDFDRLDARFRFSDEVWAALPRQYRDYGFAVFKFRKTGVMSNVHPMAFEFSTRLSDQVFIPTVHVHDGQVHPHAWFDHIVYVQGEGCSVDLQGETSSQLVEALQEKAPRKFPAPMRTAASVGARPCYYRDAKRLSPQEFDRFIMEIARARQPADWKLERSRKAGRDRFGVVWPVGWKQTASPFNVSYDGKAIPEPDFELLRPLNLEFLKKHHWMPLRRDNDLIEVLIDDPNDLNKIQDIKRSYPGQSIKLTACSPFAIAQLLGMATGQSGLAPKGKHVLDSILDTLTNKTRVDKERYPILGELADEARLEDIDLWRRLLDCEGYLYAVGLSGLLPNTDTLIEVG
jgi:hypothetical protein